MGAAAGIVAEARLDLGPQMGKTLGTAVEIMVGGLWAKDMEHKHGVQDTWLALAKG
jgi:hypothetical protein